MIVTCGRILMQKPALIIALNLASGMSMLFCHRNGVPDTNNETLSGSTQSALLAQRHGLTKLKER
jgi:hypothetical protein